VRLVLALVDMPTGPRVLELFAGTTALLLGAVMVSISLTVIGLAAWAALQMRPSSGLAVLVRWAIGGAGTVLLVLGLVFVGAGTEASLGAPFAQYSGGLSLVAYWVGFRVAVFDASATGTLLRRLADRSASDGYRFLAGWAYTVGVACWVLERIALVAMFMVAFAALVL
jgi:hypothetical protein